jgi:arginine utilization protein RocB
MNADEIIQVYLGNIENTSRVMEDGRDGYVLQFDTHMNLLCQSKGKVRKDHPLSHDVAVLTHAQAVTMYRYWNSNHPDDKVRIVKRREAMVAYIDAQQRGIELLQNLSRLAEEQRK